jgi:hypothetical protein
MLEPGARATPDLRGQERALKEALGFLAAIAAVGLVIYFAFVNPSMRVDQDRSVSFTRHCVAESEGISEDGELTKLAHDSIIESSIGIQAGQDRALVLVLSSDEEARRAERDMARTVREAHQGFESSRAEMERSIKRRIVRRSFVVLAYAMPPSQEGRKAIGECVYAIRRNRWADVIGIDTMSIGRPFREAGES